MADVIGGACSKQCSRNATIWLTSPEGEFRHARCEVCAVYEEKRGWKREAHGK